MSRDSGIEFIINTEDYSASSLLKSFLSNGWALNYNDQINVLPLGDNGIYSWTKYDLSAQDQIYEIINQKQANNEVIGVTLRWADSNIGCDFIIAERNKFLFSLTVNRKKLNHIEFADVSWYLERIIPPIHDAKLLVLSIVWSEII